MNICYKSNWKRCRKVKFTECQSNYEERSDDFQFKRKRQLNRFRFVILYMNMNRQNILLFLKYFCLGAPSEVEKQ